MFFYGARENKRWQTGNLNLLFKRPFAARFAWAQLLHQGHQAIPHCRFCNFWHFGFLAFLHSVISGISAFCNFWQAFLKFLAFLHLLQFLTFPQLLLFPWPWKFWLAVFSLRLHWCLGFYLVSCFLHWSDQGVCDVENAMFLLFRFIDIDV